uniref:Capsid protein n=1 Tax=Strongyloides papillosus TaxID=174720 RepID=A0A0N5C4T7_STREA
MSMQRSFAGYRSTFKNSFYFDNVVTVDSEGKLRSSFRRTFVQKNPRKFSTPGCQLRISDGRSPSIFYGNSGNENLMYQGKDYGKKYSVNVPIHKYSVIPTTTHKHSTIASIHKSSVTFKNRMLYVKSDNFIRNIWEKCGSTPYDDTYFGIHTISGTVSRKITQSSTRDFSKLSQKGEIK